MCRAYSDNLDKASNDTLHMEMDYNNDTDI